MLYKSSSKKRRQKIERLARAAIEPLEQRFLLSAVSWIGGSGTSWNTAANWSSGAIPNSTTDVVINQPGNISVTLTGNASVNSLALTGDTLTVSSGTLSLATRGSVNAAATLSLSAATLSLASSAALTNSGSISVSAGSDLNVGGAYTQTSTGVLNLRSGALSSGIGSNLLSNGDFEAPSVGSNTTTNPNGWGSWNNTYDSTLYAFSGIQSLVESGPNSGANQSFSVTAGISYTASVYAMTPSNAKLTGPEGAFFNIFFYDANGNQLSTAGITVLNANSAAGGTLTGSVGGQGWNLFTQTVVAPANAARVTIALQAGAYTGIGGTAGGSVYWDNAQFGPTAHTSALANAASVSNSGSVTIGAGDTLSSTGSFTQTSTGSLSLLLGGPAAGLLYGSITSGATASIAGTLIATLANGYSPSLGDAFTLLNYTGEAGAFASTALPSGASYAFQSALSPTYMGIEAVPVTTSTTVNIGTVIAATPPNVVGVNIDWWDNALTTPQTEQLVEAAGLNMFRFPGGSSSDDYHFNQSSNLGDDSAETIPQFAQFIQSVGGTGLVTTDYGSGSPQEAEAELAYLEGSPTDTTTIGTGIEWNDTTGAWQNVNWQTVGYWASLRAAGPLAHDDGLNFLRIGQLAPFANITYWEIGNEEYGSWEIDHHGTAGPGGVSTGLQRDPATYARFAQAFASFVAADHLSNFPTLHIGIDSGDPTGGSDNNWTRNVLTQGALIGFVPGFISDHNYVQGPGSESDSFLLNDTVSDVGSTLSWATRYSDYQAMLLSTVGSTAAAGVQIMATEYNSNYGVEGKQMTSIVNGLFIADSIGSLMNTGYTAGLVWDLRNGWTTSGNNSPSLYGWREGGDEGLLGSASSIAGAPSTGTYVAYPNYYAEELASKIAQAGGKVVSAVSNYNEMSVYTVLEANGHLDLMVINKNLDANITEQFSLPGFNASGQAQVWQYGEAQDYAQSLTTDGASSLAQSTTNLTFNGSNFSYMFPAYSMTVIDLTPTPVVVTAAAANPNPVTGTTTALSALGSENGISTGLTYTWSATGPASILYTGNTNGTNAAANITAQFSMAGSYNFTVTIADANGNSITSSSAVNVSQTPTTVNVTPSSATVAPGGQAQFVAAVMDQFGNPENASPILWSISSPGAGGNSINSTGLATLTHTTGTYTVTAGFGFASGSANVTVAVAPIVSTFQVNDGNVQRSMVDSLTLTFNEAVTLSAGAITLNLLSQTGGTSTPVTFTLSPSTSPSATWVLTFTGSGDIGGSLPDGAYEVIVSPNGVTSAAGLNMSTAQNFTFYRLYGDFTGQGVVSGNDFTQLVGLIGKQTNSSDWYVDYDNDGVIGGTDFTAFVGRLGKSMSIPSLPGVVLLDAPAPAATPLATVQHSTAVVSNVAAAKTPANKKKPRHGHA